MLNCSRQPFFEARLVQGDPFRAATLFCWLWFRSSTITILPDLQLPKCRQQWLCCRVNKLALSQGLHVETKLRTLSHLRASLKPKNPKYVTIYLSSNLFYCFIGRDWDPGQATYNSRAIQLVHKHFWILQKKGGQLEGNSSDQEKTILISITLYCLVLSSWDAVLLMILYIIQRRHRDLAFSGFHRRFRADIGTTKSKSTKCSRRPDRLPCITLAWSGVKKGGPA